MVLMFNSDHIIYYYMDATRSVGLVKTYFTHPDYLVVQYWTHATYLSPAVLNQTGLQIYCNVKFLLGRVEYIPLGTPCDCILVTTDYSNAAMPFVVTAFAAL